MHMSKYSDVMDYCNVCSIWWLSNILLHTPINVLTWNANFYDYGCRIYFNMWLSYVTMAMVKCWAFRICTTGLLINTSYM